MTRSDATEQIKKTMEMCIRAYVRLLRLLDEDEKYLLEVGEHPSTVVDMYVKGIPYMGLGIRRIREDHNYSIEEMARRTGIKEQKLKEYENGTVFYIPYDDIETIRKALHCSKNALVEANDRKG